MISHRLCPEFEGTNEELEKLADEDVRKVFTLAFGRNRDLVAAAKDDFVRSVQRHKGDTESLEVMIALTTISIRNRQQQLLKEPPNRSGVPRHIVKILVDRRRG